MFPSWIYESGKLMIYFHSAYHIQQCIVDIAHILHQFKCLFFFCPIWFLETVLLNYSPQFSRCTLFCWLGLLPVGELWLKWQHSIGYIKICTDIQICENTGLCSLPITWQPRGITLSNQYTMLKLFLFFTPYKGKLRQFSVSHPWNVN